MRTRNGRLSPHRNYSNTASTRQHCYEESYLFEKVLRERGIPMVVVESGYHHLDVGPVRTRLEAFVEIMEGGPANA